MSRRILLAAFAALALAAPAHATDPSPPSGPVRPAPAPAPQAAARSWAQAQIRVATAHGLMGGDPTHFRPQDPLTRGDLAALVAGLSGQAAVLAANPSATVSIAGLDSALVRELGLAPAAAAFEDAARAAGLAPPTRFGTEVAARLLGLRTNHPAAQDDLELLPTDPATRAEAAFSAARILGFSGSEVRPVAQAAQTFVLPPLTPWQQRVLTTAVGFVGYPYVWGGTSENPEAPFGVRARGGFDCSGFVWRVYKLQPYPDAPSLASTLRGRSTYAMSGEVPKAERIPFAKLEPADVLFFGPQGVRSAPGAIDHTAIYLGGGWLVHSSSQGVSLDRLAGWYRTRFTWGRRPLAEAGLTPPNGG